MFSLEGLRARVALLDRPTLWALVLFAVAFWGLRLAYWLTIDEPPFSDMADYAAVGSNIVARFYFSLSNELYAYYTPITPSFIALGKLLGGVHEMMAYRVIVASILFASTIVLARELALLTGNRWIGAGALAVTALSKASIFWSYKYCTETTSEALLIATIAATLFAIRRNSAKAALVAGLAGAALFLNRPQFIFGVLLLAPLLSPRVRDWLNAIGRTHAQTISTARPPRPPLISTALVTFCLGVAIVWSPWIARNFIHYGHIVPLATSGAEALYWEYAGAPIRVGRYDKLPGMTAFTDDARRTAIAAPSDLERNEKAQALARQWLTVNAPDLPRLIWWRLKHFAMFHGADGLTKVDRDILFGKGDPRFNSPLPPVSLLDLVLLDKTPWVCVFALVGLGLLASRDRAAGLAGAALIAAPYATAALVIGYERTVESLITPMLVFAFYGLVAVAQKLAPGAAPADAGTEIALHRSDPWPP